MSVLKKLFQRNNILALLLSIVLISGFGCPKQQDPVTVSNLNQLKEFHLQFIDTYTAKKGKKWNTSKFEADYRDGKARFEKAKAYEVQKKDADELRLKATGILINQFESDCDYLRKNAKKKRYFFATDFAKNLKKTVSDNYDSALRGEIVRTTN